MLQVDHEILLFQFIQWKEIGSNMLSSTSFLAKFLTEDLIFRDDGKWFFSPDKSRADSAETDGQDLVIRGIGMKPASDSGPHTVWFYQIHESIRLQFGSTHRNDTVSLIPVFWNPVDYRWKNIHLVVLLLQFGSDRGVILDGEVKVKAGIAFWSVGYGNVEVFDGERFPILKHNFCRIPFQKDRAGFHT